MQNKHEVLLLSRDEGDLDEHEVIALRARLGSCVRYKRIEAGNAQELIACVGHDTKAIVLPPRPSLSEALQMAVASKVARQGVAVYAFSRQQHGECLCKLTPSGELEFAWDSPPKPKLCLV